MVSTVPRESAKEGRTSVVQLLARARQLGIQLWAECGELKFRAPKGVMTAELRTEIGARRVEIMAFLQQPHAPEARPSHALALVPRTRPLPVSFVQARWWTGDQLAPGHSVHNLALTLEIAGALDVNVLHRALGELTARHEALRTTLATREGQPVQHIQPPRTVELPVVDLETTPPAQRAVESARQACALAQQPFSLEAGPLFRASLIKTAPTHHLLLLNLHPIIADAWSLALLVRELGALYRALAQGQRSPLALLPVQFADLASWQRNHFQGDALTALVDFWEEQLRGSHPLDLPTDRPRPTKQGLAGAHKHVTWSPDLSRKSAGWRAIMTPPCWWCC